jgi:probable F420-dependent oxidoreductase
VKIGVCSANSGPYTTRATLGELARLAEAFGIESIWVSDHVVVPDPREPPARMDPEDPILDPVVALAFLAGRTETVRLGSGVIVLPLRQPLVLAKQLATVDVLSGGRLIVGVGVGYVEREFEAVGVPFAERGRRTEEYVAAMRTVWGEGRSSYRGATVAFEGVRARPRPIQRPGPPIVMGGYAPPVMRRTVHEADGWYGWGLDLAATERHLGALRAAAEREVRPRVLGPLEITVTPAGDVDADSVRRYEDLGVHRLNLPLPWTGGRGELERYVADVVGPLIDGSRARTAAADGEEDRWSTHTWGGWDCL